ncbi:MAG: NfeD family protein [Alphaproteobacteria bacterium]|nr:NfeD family protein [Alphaproteobacteria bacterium]
MYNPSGGFEVWLWVAIGLTLAALEIIVPGAALIWIGLAALIVALIGWLWPTMALAPQLILFAVISGASVAAMLVSRKFTSAAPPSVNLGPNRFVGERATLETPIINGRGEARLGDTIWPVRGPDMVAGATVRVVGSDGTVLIVEPA